MFSHQPVWDFFFLLCVTHITGGSVCTQRDSHHFFLCFFSWGWRRWRFVRPFVVLLWMLEDPRRGHDL
jgi:hypothetical protein